MSVRLATTKDVSYAPQVEGIPLLPGNNFHDDPVNRSTLRKSHGLGLASAETDFICPTEYSQTNAPQGYVPTAKETPDELQGKWANIDKPFRFVAYFKEAVTESKEESYRLRKVAITYFDNDGTIMIREARQQNSGMMTSVHGGGSVLCRRQVVYDVDCTPLNLDDFHIGGEIEVYGRVYKIIDTDAATRNALVSRGLSPADPLPFPEEEDAHKRLNDVRMKKTGVRKLRTEDMDVKRIAEFALSGRYSKAHPDHTKAVRQFLTADGSRNLTFSLLWDEDRGPGKKGDVRVMTLKYHLEDDSIEVVEQKQVNSGRDGGGKFLCRQRVAKDPAITDMEVQHNTYGRLLKSNFLTFKDLHIGETYHIHGKDLLLFDADQYTRAWFEKNEGTTLPPAVDVSKTLNRDKKSPVKHYPPPHDGFGHEQDSLGNCKNLILRPMRQDVQKLLEEGHIVYKFKAQMHEPADDENKGREFVLNYYPATGDFDMFELPVKNSGIVGGKFLGKTKLYRENPRTGQKVKLGKEDMYEGAVIPVLGRSFVLVEMDGRSKKYRDSIPPDSDVANVRHLIVMLKELIQQKYDRVSVAMQAMSSSGRVGVSDLERFFAKHNQPITHQEARTLLHCFDTAGAGSLGHADFITLMEYESSLGADFAASRSAQLDRILPDAANPEDDPYDVEDKANSEKTLYSRTLTMLRDKLIQRRARNQEVFRLMAGRQTDSRLDVREFRHGLAHILHMQLSAKETDILIGALFGMCLVCFMSRFCMSCGCVLQVRRTRSRTTSSAPSSKECKASSSTGETAEG
eukprot:Rhum_TRINITY_DN10801_c0_g1::Rhum_TRINITY_DN10801_c0_g1_i1::g.40415::m.40415